MVLAAVAALVFAGPYRADAVTGDIQQLAGTDGCVSETGSGGLCQDGRGLVTVADVVTSPDGRSAYAVAIGGDAIVTFDRAADGSLTQRPGAEGCISETGADGCADGRALDGVRTIAVSPDGRSVYTTGVTTGIAVLDRDPATGVLSQKSGSAGCIANNVAGCTVVQSVEFPGVVTVSNDGRTVYVTTVTGDGVVVFDRVTDGGTIGELSQKAGTDGCINGIGNHGCAVGDQMDGAFGIVVSPDDETVYVVGSNEAAVAILDRDVTGTATHGALTRRAGAPGCVSSDGSGGACLDGHGLGGVLDLAMAPDGENLYVIGSSTVATLDRAADGGLSQDAGTAGCIDETGSDGCADGRALSSPQDVEVAPDGGTVYVTDYPGGALAVLDRDADGNLTQRAGPAGCVSDTGSSGTCADVVALSGAYGVGLSGDGRSVYVTGWGADTVASFQRQAEPISLSIADASLAEQDGTMAFTVSSTGPAYTPVSFTVTVADGTAVAGSDFGQALGIGTLPKGAQSVQVSVPIHQDQVDEPDETFTVTVGSVSPPGAFTDAVATGTITDDDATPTVSVGDTSEGEDSPMVFDLSLSHASAFTVSVIATTVNGSAISPDDYAHRSDLVTFLPGVTERTFAVDLVSDAQREYDETLVVELSSPSAEVAIGNEEGTGLIIDDDADPGVTVSDVAKKEGKKGETTEFVFSVTLSAPSGRGVQLNLSTVDGTAKAGKDYTSVSGNVFIPAGQTVGTFPVTVIGNKKPESVKVFTVVIDDIVDGTIVDGVGTGRIKNDDGKRSPRRRSGMTGA